MGALERVLLIFQELLQAERQYETILRRIA
jgi:hypothetical protein